MPALRSRATTGLLLGDRGSAARHSVARRRGTRATAAKPEPAPTCVAGRPASARDGCHSRWDPVTEMAGWVALGGPSERGGGRRQYGVQPGCNDAQNDGWCLKCDPAKETRSRPQSAHASPRGRRAALYSEGMAMSVASTAFVPRSRAYSRLMAERLPASRAEVWSVWPISMWSVSPSRPWSVWLISLWSAWPNSSRSVSVNSPRSYSPVPYTLRKD